MKDICIAGCGGPAGVGMGRCLANDKRWKVYGYDSSPWGEKMAACDTTPVDQQHCDMIIPVPDPLVKKYAECDLCFLPKKPTIYVCQDKLESAQILGDLAPKLLWIREAEGAGGKGAMMGSEYLPGRNVSVELVYKEGALIGSFMKERLSYRVNKVEHSVIGIGSSAVSKCIWEDVFAECAKAAVKRIDDEPHGIFGVDMQCNDKGDPKVTEINPGRFLTASYEFYQRGYNLPKFVVEKFLGLQVSPLEPYPLGMMIIRQTGQESWYGHEDTIKLPKGWE